jgi:O-antigen ligase
VSAALTQAGAPGAAIARTAQIALVLAVVLPTCVMLAMPPSPTLLNQCAAMAVWGIVVACIGLAAAPRDSAVSMRSVWPLAMALALTLASGIASALRAWPSSVALSTLPALMVAALVVRSALRLAPVWRRYLGAWFLTALLVAGLINACIGLVQVLMPEWPDGEWVARSSGRAVGNLRQPNHLSTLLLWSVIAVVGLVELRRLGRRSAIGIGLLLMLATVLTASRTGMVGTLLLSVWGIADRRLARSSRAALALMPLLYASLWGGAALWAHATEHVFAGEMRMSAAATGDLTSSRFAIWSDALSLIAREPLSGVGFGEFNLAWTLSELPTRPTAFFDHTHNLPLQLWVEMGVPAGSLVVILLSLAIVQAWRRMKASEGDDGVLRRAALLLLVMVGLHSMLEYPLWYAYFLLPAAFAWGISLAPEADAADAAAMPPPMALASGGLVWAGLLTALGAFAAAIDYRSVVSIYDPPDNAASLEDRIARGQASLLFGHHADYAAATAFGPPKAPLSPSQELAFKRAPHQLLDVRLMIAWSQALAAQGELDKARWLAARIREFRNSGADEYFAPCSDPAQAAQAFQCQPPTRVVHWREFTQR